ncbi:MAG TPA: cytochrome b5 domain-containing protein [Methanobacterium sp.]
MKKFTKTELARYNGKKGNLAYIAYEGKVYDVSDSFLWKGGKHQVTHKAGEDLTDALEDAPHGYKELEGYPMVGVLV